ncbi:hypothetical protein BC831DRAFT_277965 [Entophlyctis helioformis]|nr:hypothetical protein BC831DRAFT_277965 [Entophlyctis helioformis]
MKRSSIKFDDALLEKSGLTQAELQELAEIFSLVDVDHGGTISRQELESLMATVGFKASRDELDEMMNEIDKGTGEIDFESFVLTVTKKLQTSITSNELRRAFAVLQRYDPSTYPPGQISMSELIKAFTEYPDNKLSMDDAKELIRQVSSNSDKDTFNFNQFMGLYFNT